MYNKNQTCKLLLSLFIGCAFNVVLKAEHRKEQPNPPHGPVVKPPFGKLEIIRPVPADLNAETFPFPIPTNN